MSRIEVTLDLVTMNIDWNLFLERRLPHLLMVLLMWWLLVYQVIWITDEPYAEFADRVRDTVRLLESQDLIPLTTFISNNDCHAPWPM